MEQATADRRQWLRAPAQRLGLSGFWAWWTAQLAPLMPAWPRAAMQRRRLRPVVAFGADAAVVWVPRMTNGSLRFVESTRIPLAGDSVAAAQAGRAAIDALPRIAFGGALASAKVGIVLPPGQVLRKTITLPMAVADSLLPTLAFDIDRHTPFKADDLYFDAAIVARDPTRKEIRVDLVAALKSGVDQARRRTEAWGASVVGVWPEMPDAATQFRSSRLNLLPVGERPDVAMLRRWQFWLPLAVALGLAFVATALPIWQKRSHVLALTQLVEQAHQQAGSSDGLRAQLEQETGDYNFALQRKYAFPSAMQVLEDVTRLLPDDTWLTQLEVKSQPKAKEPHRDLLLRGESGNAGRLVSLLEESKLFGEAAPRSPTTKIQPGPGEIFDLGAQLKPLPVPASVPISSANRPEPVAGGGVSAESARTGADSRAQPAGGAEREPPGSAQAAGPARVGPEKAPPGLAAKSSPVPAATDAPGAATANGKAGSGVAPPAGVQGGAPMAAPVAAPMGAPPVASPVAAPVAAPTDTPVANPVVTPTGVPLGMPVGVPLGAPDAPPVNP